MTVGNEHTHLADPLGAFCRHTHVALRGAARGLLQGLTFGVKDVFHIADHPTGFGHPDWLRTHPSATVTATAVQRLLATGARMVGKTHTPVARALRLEGMSSNGYWCRMHHSPSPNHVTKRACREQRVYRMMTHKWMLVYVS